MVPGGHDGGSACSGGGSGELAREENGGGARGKMNWRARARQRGQGGGGSSAPRRPVAPKGAGEPRTAIVGGMGARNSGGKIF